MDKIGPRLLALAAAFLAMPLAAAEFFVATSATDSGTGTKENPWTLTKAFSPPTAVKPGDTIWLRGGTYTGSFMSHLKGLANKPIIVRPYPGEHVVFDSNGTGTSPSIDARGLYTWFWGFEFTNSSTDRGSSAADVDRGTGVHLLGPGTKLINSVVHDAGQGVLSTDAAPDAEISGCLLYYNGEDGPDRGHGHGIYLQNGTGNKRVVDNIMFDQFGYGVHAYTEGSTLNNLHFEGNTAFNNGLLSQVSGATTNILVGANGAPAESPTSSSKVAKGTTLISNFTYFANAHGVGMNLGYNKGIASPTILDNYVAGGNDALALINAFRPIPMSGNTFFGKISGFQATEFPNNSYFTNRPTGVKVFVRPNQYEPGRANITIYNWDLQASVGVSLKGILKAGTAYEIRNAQNFFGPAVLSGTYDGSSTLSLPMNGLAPATPVGRPAPPPTGPEFQVFVVLPKPAASNGKPPVASFSFGPASLTAGQAVAFTDASSGSITSRSWDFGDAASGAANVSTLSSPTHTYAAPGTYTVQLIVSGSGGDSTRSREITVGASPGTYQATLPVAGHVRGANNATFVTDVAVQNPTSTPVSGQLIYSPSGGGSPMESDLTLAPGEILVLPDVVASLFGVSDSLGSLQAATSGSPPAPLRLVSRTYVADGGATLGLGAVGLSSADRARGNGFVSNIAITDAFRSNLGALNLSGGDEVVTLQLHDYSGNILGRALLPLKAGEQGQWSLPQLFPGASGDGMTARITAPTGALLPLAYAAVTDNTSSDPTYYASREPAPVQYVPAIANVSGAGGSLFTSELSIVNGESGLTTLTVTFLEHDRDNTTAPTATLVLAPFETLHSDDALNELFGKKETYGALKIESDRSPGVTAFQRISTPAELTEGTVGQQVDAVSAEDFAPGGTILGLRQDAAFRSNLGLLNPGAGNATVALTLIRSPTIPLASATVVVPPRGYVQRNLASLFPSVAIPAGETLSIAINGGGNPVFAFGSVIDNTTQDPTYYPELP
jgi:PKD repeat protein